MPTPLIETFVDAQFEGDILEVAANLARLHSKPFSVAAYKPVCRSIRKAKLLLFSIERAQNGRRCEGADRLAELAEEAFQIAETSEPNIPAASRAEFELTKEGLRRHASELREDLQAVEV